jgi:hypothetical protein
MYFRLVYFTLKYAADPVQEVLHEGTSDSALAELRTLMTQDDSPFGQLLRDDGLVLANLAGRPYAHR